MKKLLFIASLCLGAQLNADAFFKQADLKLRAIVFDKALINQSWLSKGDSIAGFRLERIQNGCVLLKAQESLRLCLK